MPAYQYTPRQALARNLRHLMEKADNMSYAELSARTGGEVSAKTIGNMLNEVGSPVVSSVERWRPFSACDRAI